MQARRRPPVWHWLRSCRLPATCSTFMRKLILRCGLPPGDIVMLTAAVRDLHHTYPKKFVTDVRTFYPELWEHNPYLTNLSEDEANVEEIDCSYPLINQCNRVPYHCLQGFIEFL